MKLNPSLSHAFYHFPVPTLSVSLFLSLSHAFYHFPVPTISHSLYVPACATNAETTQYILNSICHLCFFQFLCMLNGYTIFAVRHLCSYMACSSHIYRNTAAARIHSCMQKHSSCNSPQDAHHRGYYLTSFDTGVRIRYDAPAVK